MTIVRELEIIKAALEGDIIRQKNHEKKHQPAFKAWLEDSERVLKKVHKKLMNERLKEHMLNNKNW